MVQHVNSFVTSDGKYFDTEEAAIKHERLKVNRDKYKEFLLSHGFKKVTTKMVSLLADYEEWRTQST